MSLVVHACHWLVTIWYSAALRLHAFALAVCGITILQHTAKRCGACVPQLAIVMSCLGNVLHCPCQLAQHTKQGTTTVAQQRVEQSRVQGAMVSAQF